MSKAKSELMQGEADAIGGFSEHEQKHLLALLRRAVKNLGPPASI